MVRTRDSQPVWVVPTSSMRRFNTATLAGSRGVTFVAVFGVLIIGHPMILTWGATASPTAIDRRSSVWVEVLEG